MHNQKIILTILFSSVIVISIAAYLFLPAILFPISILNSPDFEIESPSVDSFFPWIILQGYYESSTLDMLFVKSINNFDSIVLLSGKVTSQAQIRICFTTLDLYGQSFGRIDASFQYPEVLSLTPPINGNISFNVIVCVNEFVPLGNYTITITGTSDELSHSVTLPLEIRKSWGGGGLAIRIQRIDWTADSTKIYVQNVGSDIVTLTTVYFNDTEITSPEGLGRLNMGSITTLTINEKFVHEQSVHIKVVSEEGASSEGTYTVP